MFVERAPKSNIHVLTTDGFFESVRKDLTFTAIPAVSLNMPGLLGHDQRHIKIDILDAFCYIIPVYLLVPTSCYLLPLSTDWMSPLGLLCLMAKTKIA